MTGWAGVIFRAAKASGMAVPRLPRPAKIGRDGGGPDLSVLGGMGEIGAGGSLEKSGPDLPRAGDAKRYRGAKKKKIYFWLTSEVRSRGRGWAKIGEWPSGQHSTRQNGVAPYSARS